MYLRKYFQACAICNAYFPPTNWLCSLCWKALEREYLASHTIYRAEKTLPHLRLLDWHEDNGKLVKLFIESLKQGGPHFIFKRLGLEMLSRFINIPLWDKTDSPVFIPAPSRTKTKEDHAFLLAQALCFYFNGELKLLLTRNRNSPAQRKQSKRERADIQISKEGDTPSNKTFIFVDDVLTTGSTARAAFRSLNKPKNFFIFTLAWKRPPKNNFIGSG